MQEMKGVKKRIWQTHLDVNTSALFWGTCFFARFGGACRLTAGLWGDKTLNIHIMFCFTPTKHWKQKVPAMLLRGETQAAPAG